MLRNTSPIPKHVLRLLQCQYNIHVMLSRIVRKHYDVVSVHIWCLFGACLFSEWIARDEKDCTRLFMFVTFNTKIHIRTHLQVTHIRACVVVNVGSSKSYRHKDTNIVSVIFHIKKKINNFCLWILDIYRRQFRSIEGVSPDLFINTFVILIFRINLLLLLFICTSGKRKPVGKISI